MRRSLLVGLVGLVAVAALAVPGPAAAQDGDFTHEPFAARTNGHVAVSFTFRHATRRVRLTFGGRSSRIERVPDTRRAFGAVVAGSGTMRAGRSYRATLRWRDASGARTLTTRLYLHRRYPGGRG